MLKPNTETIVENKQSQQKSDHDGNRELRSFFIGQKVRAKNYREGPKWVPAMVVQKCGPLSYIVETQDHQKWRRHVDQIRKSVEICEADQTVEM